MSEYIYYRRVLISSRANEIVLNGFFTFFTLKKSVCNPINLHWKVLLAFQGDVYMHLFLIISIYIYFWVVAALYYTCVCHSVLSVSGNCASHTFCINTGDNTALMELESCATWNKQLPASRQSALIVHQNTLQHRHWVHIFSFFFLLVPHILFYLFIC